MSKCVRFSAIVVLAMAVASFASVATVEKVSFVQTTGASSAYNAATGTLTWSAGGSGMVTTDVQGDYSNFDTATITATFNGVTDLSSGGVAKAQFASGTWEFDLNGYLGNFPATFKIWGNLNSAYNEAEAVPDQLAGAAMANVLGISWNYDVMGTTAIPVAWANPSNIGSLTASTLFAAGFNLQGYNPNGWQSRNLSAQIDSVPEPATISLIAMGIAGLLRRKK
jgi:hypothetical protein